MKCCFRINECSVEENFLYQRTFIIRYKNGKKFYVNITKAKIIGFLYDILKKQKPKSYTIIEKENGKISFITIKYGFLRTKIVNFYEIEEIKLHEDVLDFVNDLYELNLYIMY